MDAWGGQKNGDCSAAFGGNAVYGLFSDAVDLRGQSLCLSFVCALGKWSLPGICLLSVCRADGTSAFGKSADPSGRRNSGSGQLFCGFLPGEPGAALGFNGLGYGGCGFRYLPLPSDSADDPGPYAGCRSGRHFILVSEEKVSLPEELVAEGRTSVCGAFVPKTGNSAGNFGTVGNYYRCVGSAGRLPLSGSTGFFSMQYPFYGGRKAGGLFAQGLSESPGQGKNRSYRGPGGTKSAHHRYYERVLGGF